MERDGPLLSLAGHHMRPPSSARDQIGASKIDTGRRTLCCALITNLFSDQLQENISGCTTLRVIALTNSMLVEEIPCGLAALSHLRNLQQLYGEVPRFFRQLLVSGDHQRTVQLLLYQPLLGDCRNCDGLYFRQTSFLTGHIPPSIENATNSWMLQLSRSPKSKSVAGVDPF